MLNFSSPLSFSHPHSTVSLTPLQQSSSLRCHHSPSISDATPTLRHRCHHCPRYYQGNSCGGGFYIAQHSACPFSSSPSLHSKRHGSTTMKTEALPWRLKQQQTQKATTASNAGLTRITTVVAQPHDRRRPMIQMTCEPRPST